MRAFLLLTGAAVAAVLAVLLVASAAPRAGTAPPQGSEARVTPHPACTTPGCQSLSLDARTLDGRRLGDAELRGKVVLVNFWATWCAPCLEELPALAEVYGRKRQYGFEIVGVLMDGGPDAEVRDFMTRHRMDWPIVRADEKLVEWAGLQVMPTSLLFDADGRLVASWRGPISAATLEAFVGTGSGVPAARN